MPEMRSSICFSSFAPARSAAILLALLLAPAAPAAPVSREIYKDIRGRYEGLTLRLRIDLKAGTSAAIPNVVSLDGVGYGRERAPVVFGRMEKVYLERITSEGSTRLGLTVYRSHEEADRLRASAIPQPTTANPNFGRTVAAFAQQGSTSIVLELKAGKKDAQGQRQEIETLLDRVFYREEPGREEMEEFVRRHRGLPVSRLRSVTGLDVEVIRRILDEAAAPPEGTGP
ncbi:MAG: hypothetical protein HY510_01000 [Acidobacteria bacterium]|nr:hypothetical protein [Acidobacteriota bacterium]